MMKKTKSIVIVAAMTTLLTATAVYASPTNSINAQTPRFSQSQSLSANNGLKTYLDGLVTAGTITQAQEDAIQTALDADKPDGATKGDNKKGENGGFITILDTLVTAGTITQAQEDAIQTALQAAKSSGISNGDQKGDKGGFTTVLDSLVTDGTITQAQEDAIQTALNAAKPSGISNGDHQKGKNGGFTNRENKFKTVLDSLVTAGTITQSQADTIQSTIPSAK